MSEEFDNPELNGKDTSPLRLAQLSDEELRVIHEIEARLYAAGDLKLPDTSHDPAHYLQSFSKRDPRVLLLDGGRGTGKTSMLLTMANWWHGHVLRDRTHGDLDQRRKKRLENILPEGEKVRCDIPRHVEVLGIVDFDPLPKEMPLIAGLIQAWQPLAEYYDKQHGHDHRDGLLMDKWHGLFQIAAVGWTPIPSEKGLIEQILDREEQVKDWYRLGDSWNSFVHEAIKRAKKVGDTDNTAPNKVFVIMIDDVDLQVQRIRELLPALRMLYHPRVFFIVAADREHMISMLELDFLGQQTKLAKDAHYHESTLHRRFDKWPDTLARAAFQKVFAPTNKWSLGQLTLRDLLNFPKDVAKNSIRVALNKWQSKPDPLGRKRGLGDYLYQLDTTGRLTDDKQASKPKKTMSTGADDLMEPLDLAPMMPYRLAHQLSNLVQLRESSRNTALQLMGQIIEGADGCNSKVKLGSKKDDPHGRLEYLAVGELAAVFPKVFTVEIAAGKEIVLSGRPKFSLLDSQSREVMWRAEEQSNIWPHLLAASLRHDGFGVVASGLTWNVYLALAWTSVPLGELNLAFWWRVHELPSPLQFVAWAREWSKFVQELSELPERPDSTSGGEQKATQRARIAYGWIYYQLLWMTDDRTRLKNIPGPFEKTLKLDTDDDWKTLLKENPTTDEVTWRTQTLPLLARPELFLPPALQTLFLADVDSARAPELGKLRRRLITDAIVAGRYTRGSAPDEGGNRIDVNNLADTLNSEYQIYYNGQTSPWVTRIEGSRTDFAKV